MSRSKNPAKIILNNAKTYVELFEAIWFALEYALNNLSPV